MKKIKEDRLSLAKTRVVNLQRLSQSSSAGDEEDEDKVEAERKPAKSKKVKKA